MFLVSCFWFRVSGFVLIASQSGNWIWWCAIVRVEFCSLGVEVEGAVLVGAFALGEEA